MQKIKTQDKPLQLTCSQLYRYTALAVSLTEKLHGHPVTTVKSSLNQLSAEYRNVCGSFLCSSPSLILLDSSTVIIIIVIIIITEE